MKSESYAANVVQKRNRLNGEYHGKDGLFYGIA